MFQKLSFPWIKSAPLIYPFLEAFTSSHPKKHKHVESAWNRYKNENSGEVDRTSSPVKVHLMNFQEVPIWSSSPFHEWRNSLSPGESKELHVYCWIRQDKRLDRKKMQKLLNLLGQVPLLTVVPVGAGKGNSIATAVEFIRLALEYGLSPKISRYTPLCSLDETNAWFLLNSDAFELVGDKEHLNSILFTKPGCETKVPRSCNSIKDICQPIDNVFWLEKPHSACTSCGFYPLSLCRGGFFSKA